MMTDKWSMKMKKVKEAFLETLKIVKDLNPEVDSQVLILIL
jgi:hypothetical protein